MRFASINIERSNHLTRVVDFLQAYQPDVVCLQEVCARDLPLFENLLNQPAAYAPMTNHPAEVELAEMGVAIVARTPLAQVATHYYFGNGNPVPTIQKSTDATGQLAIDSTSIHKALVCATVNGFRISTTHLTWTQKGGSSLEQLHDADNLLKFANAEAAEHGGLVMCGDFNAPRGGATFAKIAEHFADGIPAHYQGSLDLNLHRVGKQNPAEAERMKSLMVDGLFHTPNYKIADAKLSAGVSDHMAVTATLSV